MSLRQFVECDLSAGLDIATVTAIPGDALIWLKRGYLASHSKSFPSGRSITQWLERSPVLVMDLM